MRHRHVNWGASSRVAWSQSNVLDRDDVPNEDPRVFDAVHTHMGFHFLPLAHHGFVCPPDSGSFGTMIIGAVEAIRSWVAAAPHRRPCLLASWAMAPCLGTIFSA